MQNLMPDGNTAALRAYEAQQDRRQRHYDSANTDRARLIDGWIADASMADLLDVLNEMGLAEMNEIKRMVAATAKGVNLGVEANQYRLMVSAGLFCQLLRTHVDHMHGEDLVNAEADRVAEDRPCRCRGEFCSC